MCAGRAVIFYAVRARMRVRVTVVVAVLLWAASAAAAQAGTITVANTNDSGPGSLRQAILTAAPGETIVVPAGLYTLSTEQLTIEKSLTIIGAGSAETILSAGGGSRVLKIFGKGIAVTVRGVTIRDGVVEEPGETAQGGGVYDSEATLTLENALVTHNIASADGLPGEAGGIAQGGGIFATGPLHLVNVTFMNDTASAVGGALEPGGIAQGGGVSATDVTLEGVSFTADRADARGGQGAASNGQPGGIAQGGGLFVFAKGKSPVSLAQVAASTNTADASGGPGAAGGIAQGGGLFIRSLAPPISIAGLTAASNLAQAAAGTGGTNGGIAQGGGLFADTQEHAFSIVNATITGNAARAPENGDAKGGGVWAEGETEPVTLTSSTVDANAIEGTGTSSGGGDLYSSEGVKLHDTIVSAGTGPAGRESCAGPVESLGNNLEDRNECGLHGPGDKVNVSPILGPLQANGGPLQTQALLPGSPAVDAGAGCASSDERGIARPQGAVCDIGAFELALPVVSTAPASSVGTTSATLNGAAANPDLLAGSFQFQYGTTAAYGSLAGASPLAAGLSGTPFSVAVTGLVPGVLYHFRAMASNPDGTSFGADQTFTTVVLQPVLSGLSISPSSLRAESGKGASLSAARKKRGATISYSDSQQALTTFTVQSPRQGFRVGKLCQAKKPRRHRGRLRRCTRYVKIGSFTHSDRAGPVKLHFTGRVKSGPLGRGRYLLVAVARNAAGKSSKPATREFRIVR